MLVIYSFAFAVVLLLGLPYWLLQMIRSGKYREGVSQRLGRVPGRLRSRGGQRAIWVHAVSVGEVLAASRLVEQLSAELSPRAPEFRIVLSTTTRTGQRLARERLGAEPVFYFPLDFGWIVRRYFRHLRPALLVLVETELWPNVLAECRKAAIPVAVVNARISNRSFPRYLALRWLWRRTLPAVSLALAQSEEDARRLRLIGVPAERVAFGGNLKFDVLAVEKSAAAIHLSASLPQGARVLVCGSTLEGEEEILLQAFHELKKSIPELMMVLAPRHPERFDRVAKLIEHRDEPMIRRSRWLEPSGTEAAPVKPDMPKSAPIKLKPGTVVLLDSMGELASVYALASIAFVGGSLVPAGGHNPLEPAQFGVPIVMGPHYENFRAIVDRFLEGEALKLAVRETLVPILSMLLGDIDQANLLGVRALEIFDSQTGATRRAVQAILRLLPPPPAATSPKPDPRQNASAGPNPDPNSGPEPALDSEGDPDSLSRRWNRLNLCQSRGPDRGLPRDLDQGLDW